MTITKQLTTKALLIVGAVLAVVAIFTAGYYTRGYYETQQTKSAQAVASDFVSDLVTGKTETAYGLTAKSLQSKQSKSSFVSAIGDVKSSKPTYGGAQYMMRQGKFYYSQRVFNLPKTSQGSTTGDFLLTLDKQGTSWRVTTVSIQ